MPVAERHKKRSFILRRPWRIITANGTDAATPSHRLDSGQSTTIPVGAPTVSRSSSSRSIIRPWGFARGELGGSTISLPSSSLISGLVVADHIARVPVFHQQPNPAQAANIGESSLMPSPGLVIDIARPENQQRDNPDPIDITRNPGPSRPASAPAVGLTTTPKNAPNEPKLPGQVEPQQTAPRSAPVVSRPQSPPLSNSPVGNSPILASPIFSNPQVQPSITAGPASRSQSFASGPAATTVTTLSRSLSVRGQGPSLSRQIAQSGAQNDISSTIDTLQKAFQHAKQRQRKFTNRHGQEVLIAERIGQILRGIQDYAKIVDVAIQHNPEITALIWAGVRSILMIALYRVELLDNLELAMSTIVETMAIGEFYNQIYATTPWSNQVLSSPATTAALKNLFATALQDLHNAIQFFAQRAVEYVDPESSAIQRFGNVFKPFAVVMKPLIDAITEKKSTLQRCAEMATMKSTQEMANSIKGLEHAVEDIKNLMAPMSNLDDILSATTDTLALANEIKVITTGNMDLTTEVLNVASETRDLTTRALDTTTNVLGIGTKTFNKTEEIFTLTTDNVRTAEQTLHLVTGIQSTTASSANVATQNLVVSKQVHEAVLGVESRVEALVTHQHQTLFKEKSVEIEIQELKTDYLASQELMEEFQRDLYIPAKGMANPHDKPSRHFDLAQKMHLFLAPETPAKVCLLHGMAGSGKSTFNHSLARTLWGAFDKISETERSHWSIPVFITLATLHNPNLHNQDLIASYFHARGMSESNIKELRHTRKFVFILDGYDEIENRDCNFYLNNKLAEWQAKIVVTSRPEYLGVGYRKKFHPPGESHHLQEYWLAPFGPEAVAEYIDRYVRANPSSRSVADYQEIIARPEVAELISNPFLLRMVMTVEPSKHNLKRGTLYKQFVFHWLEQAQNRLQTIQLSVAQRAAFSQLDDEGFTSHAHRFCQQFALALYRCQSVVATYDATLDHSYNGTHTVHPPSLNQSRWGPFLANFDNRTRLLRFSSPIARSQQSYRFIHKSIRDYLVAQAIWLDGSMAIGDKEALFNEFNIVDDPGIVDFIIEQASEDETLREQCLAYIEKSKVDHNVQLAAANAITILVKTGRSFAGCDLGGIRIPGADLNGGWFDGAILRGADLTGVRMHSVWLRAADLRSTALEGLSFGERPFITTNRASWSTSFKFSPDGTACAVISSTVGVQDEITYSIDVWSLLDHSLVYQIPVLRRPKNPDARGISVIAFSPDGKELITAGADERIHLFSLGDTTHELLHTFTDINLFHPVHHLTYGPSSDVIISGSLDNKIRLWSKSERRVMHTTKIKLDSIHDLQSCPQGNSLASCHGDHSVRLWSITNLEQEHCFRTKGGSTLHTVAFSPDGRLLAAAGGFHAVRIWSVENKAQLHFLTNEMVGVINHIAFSPDSQLLATDTEGHAVHLWSLTHKRIVHTYTGEFQRTSVLAFSPDSQFLAISAGRKDTKVTLWTVPHSFEQNTGLDYALTDDHTTIVKNLRFSPDGTLLVNCSSSESQVTRNVQRHFGRIWPLKSDACPPFPSMLHHAHTVAFPSDSLLYVLEKHTKPNAMQLYSINPHNPSVDKQGNLQTTRTWETTPMLDDVSAVLSCQGHLLAFPSNNGEKINLWSVEEPKELKSLNPNAGLNGGRLRNPVFSEDDRLLAAEAGSKLCLWSIPDGNLLHMFDCLSSSLISVAVSSAANLIACASVREVTIWGVQQTQCSLLQTITEGSYPVAFSKDGTLLAMRHKSDRTSIGVWSIATQSTLAVVPSSGTGDVVAVAWSPGQGIDQLALGMANGEVQLWHVKRVRDGVEISAVWSSTRATQVVLTGARVDGVKGLDQLNKLLLQQKGVVGLETEDDQTRIPIEEAPIAEGENVDPPQDDAGEEGEEWVERDDGSGESHVVTFGSTDDLEDD